ncbi:type VI secretion system Vgr family protein, partial [Cronobacter dublinensis]
FHWDRLSKGDDTSSGWVRVSSAWAGQGFGGVQIPRVGDEVVVDFINGDPDRPLITGRVYNEASMPPWELPGDATRMGFMTRSKDGHRDNASYLFFEDKMGDELLDMHAEKNMNISVENDKTVAIDGCRTTTIGREQKDEVTGDASFYYKQKRTTVVDNVELKDFNNSEIINIKEGRKLTISGGGELNNITGSQTTTIAKGDQNTTIKDGKQETIISTGGRNTEIKNGDRLIVSSGGQHTEIKGGVKTVIDGGWTQTIKTGETLITSPNKITIKSSASVEIEAPFLSSDVKGTQMSITGLSGGITGMSFGLTGVAVSHNIVDRSTKNIDLSDAEVKARLKNKIEIAKSGIKTYLNNLFIIG